MDCRIRIVIRIIGEQKGKIHFTLKASSRLLGVTEAHLLRLFKREVGMTLGQYSREARMAEAAKMLRTRVLSIKEIALASGYEDVSNFYRDFKQAYRTTPRQWQLAAVLAGLSSNSLR